MKKKGHGREAEYFIQARELEGRWLSFDKKTHMVVDSVDIDEKDHRRVGLIGDITGNDKDLMFLFKKRSRYNIYIERSSEIQPGRKMYYGLLWAEPYDGTVFVQEADKVKNYRKSQKELFNHND